jgi:bile acid-CoA:amino acid N-acyltransferase
VIDLFGGAGGCIELRAALLAKQGFATLALAYFAYDDLSAKTTMDFSMNYFEQAVDWFVHQSEVQPGGIGMVGVCLGSQIALLMAIRDPRIRAAACINQSLVMLCDPELRGNPLRAINPKTMFHYPPTGIHYIVDGRLHGPMPPDMAKIRHPQFKSTFDNHILFIIGGDEHRMCPEKTIADVVDHLKTTGRKNVHMEVIEGQGHLIEPPYSPLCVESRDGSTAVNTDSYENVHPGLLILSNLISDWGGKRDTHEVQQMKAWTTLVNFLKQRLCSDVAKL